MKKFLSILLAFLLTFSLAGCTKNNLQKKTPHQKMPWRFSQLSGPHTRTTTNFRLWAVTTTI